MKAEWVHQKEIEHDTVQDLMWQDDMVSVAKFIKKCLNKVHVLQLEWPCI